MKWGLFGSLLAMLAVFGGGFLQYFYPRKIGTFGGKVTVPGTVADYPVGTVTRVREGKFYLSHVPDGLLALYWKCKHLGCTVPWKPDEEFQGQVGVFHCPCHGSVYLPNGQNVAGPAPAPLDLMAIDLSGGKIVVDTGKITTRVQYNPSQAVKV
jgi:cytochrome b6-f complex iron-sulfur subunit